MKHVEGVALNALFLSPGDSGGPETYTRELMTALAREYPRLRIVLFTTVSGRRALAADGFGEIAELRALPAEEYRRARRQLSEQILLPIATRRAGVGLLHSLASTAPLRSPGMASVVTVHDVTFVRTATFGRATTWGLRQVVTRAARDADALIAVSAAARDDICGAIGLDPARFTVVPHGAGPVPRGEPADEGAVRARLGLDGRRLVLCVSALRPHKNQELLVRAAPRLPEDALITLAGRQEPYVEHLRELSRALRVEDRVRLVGYLPEAELERAWLLASCAAFPTRAEGFGLPMLEAMARGVPVACSDIPALRELGGDVPRYFQPDDPAGAAGAVAASLGDRERGRRGAERARRFSWSEAAKGTMEAYERAVAARRT